MDVKLVIFSCLFSLGSCGIIPEELFSLLSLAYGYIPPVKKGTDSRVGFGFAFGNHADFQVMFEFGPQNKTQKLNGQGFRQGVAKRQALQTHNVIINNRQKHLQTEGSNYLQTWAQQIKQSKPRAPPGQVPNHKDFMVELVKNERGEYEIRQPRSGAMPVKLLENLKRLYRQKTEEAKKLGEKNRTSEKENRGRS